MKESAQNMIPFPERQALIALIKREVVPAIGCTEPIAVALAVAKACELLQPTHSDERRGQRILPEQIRVDLSANILKNAMGVGIPGTGMIGLPIVIALGAIAGKSEYELEVLRDATAADVELGKKLIAEQRIQVYLKNGITENLYIEVLCKCGDKEAKVIIAGAHTRFVYLELNGKVLLDKRACTVESAEEALPELNMRKVYTFATTAPLEEITFILESARMNKAAAEVSFQGHYGHQLGRMMNSHYKEHLMGESFFADVGLYIGGM